MTKKETRQKKALASADANRILWLFDRRVAYALFVNGLNAVSAAKMDDRQLLQHKGIGPAAVYSIRRASNSANGVQGENFVA
jgi:hypothetical protein